MFMNRTTTLPEESEGVIKYHLEYYPSPLADDIVLDELIAWRDILFRLGLTGMDPHRYGGLAYGNVSMRLAGNDRFVISGTQTGGIPALRPEHFSVVRSFDLAANRISASGPVAPSSEALTHALIYRQREAVTHVIHVHSPLVWADAASLNLPVTSPEARYGSPEMVAEVNQQMLLHPAAKLIAMGGHRDGLIAFGTSPGEAAFTLIESLAQSLTHRAAGAPI